MAASRNRSGARSGSSRPSSSIGVIMSILDTTIVNVALETLSRELDAPLNTIQWVVDGLPARARDRDPAHGLDDRALRLEADLDDLGHPVRRRQRALRARLVGRVADLLPRAAGLRRRHDHAGRDGAAGPDGRAGADRARDERDRRADAARPDPRPGARRPDRRLRLLALDLLRQRADRDLRARAGGEAAEAPTPAAPTPASSTGVGLLLLSPGLGLFVFGLSESESHGGFSRPGGVGPDGRRRRCSWPRSCATRCARRAR